MLAFRTLFTVVAALSFASAIDLNVDDAASIRNASSTIVYDMLKTWYIGNTSALASDYGTLPKPYYWWEAGAMFGGLVDYSHYTGDASYDETVAKAIVSQASSTTDFMMIATESYDLGNDDMLFWALTALNAAEYNFHVPSGQASDIYFRLSRNVFNLMVSRWNTTTCNGGLKWQWLPANNGFYYKSTITNTAFFQVAARLGRMTGNQTYLDWANKAYNWMEAVGYIDSNYFVYDGAGDANKDNCSVIDHHQWSYNIASTIAGAAYMYNATSDPLWRTRSLGFLSAIKTNFVQPFPNATNILYERDCEAATCNTDQLSFKAYLAQSIAKAAVVHPELTPDVNNILKTSAQAAAKTCTGGSTGHFCGTKWYTGIWDGSMGVGQQMTAFQAISSLLIWSVGGPVKRADSAGSNPPPPVSSNLTTATATAASAASTFLTRVSSASSATTTSDSGSGTITASASASIVSAQQGNPANDDAAYWGSGAEAGAPCACVRIGIGAGI